MILPEPALLKLSKKGGVKGMHPLDGLPLRRRVGVTLQTANKKKRITGKKISTEHQNLKKLNVPARHAPKRPEGKRRSHSRDS